MSTITDEFFADILSARIAKGMGLKSETIARHLFARRSYFRGFPIDKFVLEGRRGVLREIKAGRFRPRAVERPREPLFRKPTERVTLPGMGKNKPSIFPGRSRRPMKTFSRRI